VSDNIVEMARVLRVTQAPLDNAYACFEKLSWHFRHVPRLATFVIQNHERLKIEVERQNRERSI
jgi:hypothetical protein